MINRFYKIINNKFPRFLKFVFFLRYLFLLFFISLSSFLLIPNLFDYKKKEDIIKTYLLKNYNLNVTKIEKIKFRSFPLPSLEIQELEINFPLNVDSFKTKKIIIYPKLKNIYNFENFQINKLILIQPEIITDIKNIHKLNKYILKINKKIHIKNLNLNIKNNKVSVINLNNIDFQNFGYKKNIIDGEVFGKKFKLTFQENFKKVDFKILNTGIFLTFNLKEKNESTNLMGSLKGKFLKSNLKLDFIYDQASLKIDNLFFRDKSLSLDSDGLVILKPFLEINLNSKLKNFDRDIFNKVNVNSVLKQKNILKRLNVNNKISYKSKKFSREIIDNFDIKTNLAYGRLNFSKNLSISGTDFECSGNINLLDDYPVLNFVCTLNSPDKRKLLKKLKIDEKIEKGFLNINVIGYLNILNQKVNFDFIEIDKVYKTPKEDLLYFKTTFERLLFDKNFTDIFNLKKIRNFISEIL